AASPAPASITTEKPSLWSFLAVPGVAATRRSPSKIPLTMPTFIDRSLRPVSRRRTSSTHGAAVARRNNTVLGPIGGGSAVGRTRRARARARPEVQGAQPSPVRGGEPRWPRWGATDGLVAPGSMSDEALSHFDA